MAFGKAVSDKTLQRSVDRKLLQRGGGSAIKAVVQSGTVTLSGLLTQAFQRRMLVNAMSGIAGVRRVVDNMSVAEHKKRT